MEKEPNGDPDVIKKTQVDIVHPSFDRLRMNGRRVAADIRMFWNR